jgi:Ca2+-binding RTX toxin-like protein
MVKMSAWISRMLIGRRRRSGLGCAVAVAGAALLCAPALAATDVAVQGTVLAVDSGKGPDSTKGKGSKGPKGPKGPKEANRISIAFDLASASYAVSDVVDVTTKDAACTDLGTTVTCLGAGITAVQASSGRGNDLIAVAALPAPSVTLNGDDDDDTLVGANDATGEVLNGGRGNDRMFGGAGPDVFNGDRGFDTVSYGDHAAGVLVTIGSPSNDGNASDAGATGALDSVSATVERIKGTSFADVLKGDAANNALIGAAGDDRLKGKKGRDRLKGKGGIDVLLARDGTADLSINCGPGRNRLERAKFDKRLDPKPKSC